MALYFGMSNSAANEYLNDRDSGTLRGLDQYVSVKGTGEGTAIPDGELAELQRELRDLTTKVAASFGAQARGREFEASSSEQVHQAFSNIPRSVLADPDFWRWLSVAEFADIVEWRFSNPGAIAKNRQNYGIGRYDESLMYRLWLRGDIGYQASASDPYELSRLRDMDLWRSHLIRERFANARHVARGLLKLQAGDAALKTSEPRLLVPMLKKVAANVIFPLLLEHEAEALIAEMSSKVRSTGS